LLVLLFVSLACDFVAVFVVVLSSCCSTYSHHSSSLLLPVSFELCVKKELCDHFIAIMESSSLVINLDKFERVYRPNAPVEGSVDVHAYKGWQHQGLKLVIEGKVYLNYTGKTHGLLDSLASTVKPTIIYNREIEIVAPGKFNDGTTTVPFNFIFAPGTDAADLMESYHGVFVSVVYIIQAYCDRGMMKKSIVKEMEFIVEIPTGNKGIAPPSNHTEFNISKETLENVSEYDLSQIPPFKITGNLHKSAWSISLPFTGEVRVEQSDSGIKSIELQLVRVENITPDQGPPTREATEIQTIQIGEGNISRNLVVPMYMVFPRLFSCPSITTKSFKLEWEVNLIVLFENGYMVTENFPITLFRDL
jgi:hypothetical protein